jgi:hypothetical protein
VPVLREHLTDHRLDFPSAGGEPAFPTRNGTRPHPDNVRARILAPLRAHANQLLDADGRVPIAHMTPHTLRRTFASILAACDVPPRRAMYLMGHTDPTLTLAVYQQVLDMGRGSVDRLEEILGCSLAEARAIYNGETVAAGISVLNPCSDTKTPPRRAEARRRRGRKSPGYGEISEAAEGTRTLDLLHGKQTL